MKTFYRWLLNLLFRIVWPPNWVSLGSVDWNYDRYLNDAIDQQLPVKIGNHTTMLGSAELWTSNFPYSYGNVYSQDRRMPCHLTRYRLRRYIHKSGGNPFK